MPTPRSKAAAGASGVAAAIEPAARFRNHAAIVAVLLSFTAPTNSDSYGGKGKGTVLASTTVSAVSPPRAACRALSGNRCRSTDLITRPQLCGQPTGLP